MREHDSSEAQGFGPPRALHDSDASLGGVVLDDPADLPDTAGLQISSPRNPTSSGEGKRGAMRLYLKGFLPTALTNGLLLLFAIGSSVIVSRTLGPHGRGEYVAWQVWASTLGILVTIGVPQAVVTLPGGRDAIGLRSIAAAATGLCLTAAAVGAVALDLIHAPMLAIAAGAAAAGASAYSGIQVGIQQRRGNMVIGFNLARLAPQLAAFTSAVLVALSRAQDPAVWFVVTSTLQVVAIAMCGVILRQRHLNATGPRSRELLATAVKLAPANALTQVQYRADSLAVAALFPATAVGYYAVATAAGNAVLSIGQAGGMVRFGKKSSGSAAETAGPFVLTLLLSAFVAMFARPIVTLLYGSAFLPAVTAVQLLAFAGFFQSVDYFVLHVAMLHGRTMIMVVLKALYVGTVGLLIVRTAHQTGPSIDHVGVIVVVASAALSLAMLVSLRSGRRRSNE